MMETDQIVIRLRVELKEGFRTVGSSQSRFVRRLAKKYFEEIVDLEKQQIFSLCEQLLQSRNTWECMIASAWISEIKPRLTESYFDIFENGLSKYIFSWGTCDDFCKRVLNFFVDNFPNLFKKIQSWTSSKNKWVRRASAVSFITTDGPYYVVKHDIGDVFDIARRLLTDEDHHVQKGYGWMLKATSVYHQKEVFEFVMGNKERMPRTALRYAIEKLPEKMKQQAMLK